MMKKILFALLLFFAFVQLSSAALVDIEVSEKIKSEIVSFDFVVPQRIGGSISLTGIKI